MLREVHETVLRGSAESARGNDKDAVAESLAGNR